MCSIANPCPLTARSSWKAGRKKKKAAAGFASVKFATPRATCWRAARLGLWRSIRNISSALAPNEKKFRDSQLFSEEKEHASKETERQRQRSRRQGQGLE